MVHAQAGFGTLGVQGLGFRVQGGCAASDGFPEEGTTERTTPTVSCSQ